MFPSMRSVIFESVEWAFFTLILNPSAMRKQVSKSIWELILTTIPFFMSSPMMRASGIPILSENSLTVRKSPISTSWPDRSTRVCLISSIFFSCFSPTILFWRRKVSRSSFSVARNASLCFEPFLVGLKFFFGASGLRKFPLFWAPPGLWELLFEGPPGRRAQKPPEDDGEPELLDENLGRFGPGNEGRDAPEEFWLGAGRLWNTTAGRLTNLVPRSSLPLSGSWTFRGVYSAGVSTSGAGFAAGDTSSIGALIFSGAGAEEADFFATILIFFFSTHAPDCVVLGPIFA